MSKRFLVYMYTNEVTLKKYIGITTKEPAVRAGTNGNFYRGSPLFYSAILKHGWSTFHCETLYRDLSKEEAAAIEKRLIDEHDTTNPDKGYNLHKGGFETCYEDVHTRKDRVDRIKETLRTQRSDPVVREQMRDRMCDVWKRPEHQQKIAVARENRTMPKRTILVHCLETDITYPGIKDAMVALKNRTLFKKLKEAPFDVYVKCGSRVHPVIHVKKMRIPVDIKRGELLELAKSLSHNNATGNGNRDCQKEVELPNQQPSSLTGEGPETIPQGSTPELVEAPRPPIKRHDIVRPAGKACRELLFEF